jgi:hypothetical protein
MNPEEGQHGHQYTVVSDISRRPTDDVDRRRVTAVCEWASDVRRHTGCEPLNVET